MPYILLGAPAYNIYADILSASGFAPISLPPEPRVNRTVSYHADTLIWSDRTSHIVNADYACRLPQCIRALFVTVQDTPHGDYPTDTIFNALRVGCYLFARTASLSPAVRATAEANGLTLVNVNQGYAKCSTLALNGARAAITADNGMASAMESYGIDVLRIRPGYIALDSCEYGFIGGASFVYEPLNCCSLSDHSRYVYFFGNLSCHPDSGAIRDFLSKRGYEVVSLGGKLTDYGSAVIIQ